MSQTTPLSSRVHPSKTHRRSQADRREESGRGLVHAAVMVVADRGVSGATFEAIGLNAGYSRSLVTERFGSRQGLIDAVIAYLHEGQDKALETIGIDRMNGLDAVLAYTDVYLRELSERRELRAYFRLLSSAVADATALRSAFAAEHERVRSRLRALVARGQGEGVIRREIDADAAALMVGSLQLGLSMQLLVDPTLDLNPIRQTTLATLRLSFEAAGDRLWEAAP